MASAQVIQVAVADCIAIRSVSGARPGSTSG